jgi:hypothetical protein
LFQNFCAQQKQKNSNYSRIKHTAPAEEAAGVWALRRWATSSAPSARSTSPSGSAGNAAAKSARSLLPGAHTSEENAKATLACAAPPCPATTAARGGGGSGNGRGSSRVSQRRAGAALCGDLRVDAAHCLAGARFARVRAPREARRLCALCEDSCGGVPGVRRGDPFDSGEDGA